MTFKLKPTFERVDSQLRYDASSGHLYWKVKGRNRRLDRPAGHHTKDGYIDVGIDRRVQRAHRVAWLLAYGEWPPSLIDHINGDRADNRIENLRIATIALNSQNTFKPHKDSITGVLGVTKRGKQWGAQIGFGGRNIYIGCFATAELAHSAYVDAKRRLHTFGQL